MAGKVRMSTFTAAALDLWSVEPSNLALGLVDVASEWMPDALPVRPDPGRPFDPTDLRNQIDAWWQGVRSELIGGLFRCRRGGPWFDGTIQEPNGPWKTWTLSLHGNADLLAEQDKIEQLTGFLGALGDQMGAVYACVQTEANAEMYQGEGFVTGDNCSDSGVRRTEGWMGLPPVPAWIEWFGQPYLKHVENRPLPATATTAPTETGLLIRWSHHPELRTHPDLVAGYEALANLHTTYAPQQRYYMGGLLQPLLLTPAALIPDELRA